MPPPHTSEQEDGAKAKERARALLGAGGAGALATLDASGAPLATLVTYAPDGALCPLLLLSALSAHTQNLMRDARASLLITSPQEKGDPLAHPRLTIVGTARMLDKATDDYAQNRARFLAHQPKAKLYMDFADFALWRLMPSMLHYNGGFGAAAPLTVQDVFGIV